MVISKKDKKKFKKAMSVKTDTVETEKRGRGRPSKAEKLQKKIDLSLPKEERIVGDGIIDTHEEVSTEIIAPDLQETLVQEQELPEVEIENLDEKIPNFLDEEEIQEALSEREDEIKSQRDDFENIDLEEISTEEKTKEENLNISDNFEEEEIDLSDFDDEEIQQTNDKTLEKEEVSENNFQEQEEVETEVKETQENLENLEDEVQENNLKEKTKVNFMEKLKKNKNYVIVGAVALVVAGAWVFAFKDKIFWNNQTIEPIAKVETPINENNPEPKDQETKTPSSDLFTKTELSEENKLLLNTLVPMSMTVEKSLQEVYDARRTNETNHWVIKNYDKKTKKTSILDIKTQLSQNLQAIEWVDETEDDLVKGKSDTDSEGNELSPEEKMKRENNPALSIKKYNGDNWDVKWEIKTSLIIKQWKEKKYSFKINADVEGKQDKTYMFFKNFWIDTKDQDLLDKSELDKFSLQNKMLTISDEKDNVEMLDLLGEYRTQLLGFNFLANILNNSDVEWVDEVAKNSKDEDAEAEETDEDNMIEEEMIVDGEKQEKKKLVTTSANWVKEETKEETIKEEKEDLDNEEDEIVNEQEWNENIKDEQIKLKALYKIDISGSTIKTELEKIFKAKTAINNIFFEEEQASFLKDFVEAIKNEDMLHLTYTTKDNKTLVEWELAGYEVNWVFGDKEEIILKKDGKETKINFELSKTLLKVKINSGKEEILFENWIIDREGIYKTHFLFSKNLIKKSWKKTNVYKLSNRGILAKDNDQLPVYVKEHTEENLKWKYEINFRFITTEYNKLIDKAFGGKEDKEENKNQSSDIKENEEVKENKKEIETEVKEDAKKELDKKVEKNSKKEKVKNPVKEVFKEVEKEDAKVWTGAVAEQPK